VLGVATAALVMGACRRDGERGGGAPAGGPAEPAQVVVFPEELRADDPALNNFMLETLETCVAGDYEGLRLRWSVAQEPVTREQFDYGWHAVQQIRVLALERLRDQADGAVGYAFAVEVRLDPERLPPEALAVRHVVLMAVQERGAWRLARAPKAVRRWIMARAGLVEAGDPAAESDAEPETRP